MKYSRAFLCLALLAGSLPAFAALESAQPANGCKLPAFPATLRADGVTKGHVVIAVSIDAEGKVQDSLVLAYTQPQLARASLEALREWIFIPARLDGTAVPVQTELRFEFTREGVCFSTNSFNYISGRLSDDRGDAYRPSRMDELDHLPVKIAGNAPKYAPEAAKDGVHGRVQVCFYIDENGDVRLPAVVASGEHPYLAEQAVAAVRTWKFEAARMHGTPVLVAAAQDFDFGDVR